MSRNENSGYGGEKQNSYPIFESLARPSELELGRPIFESLARPSELELGRPIFE
jgi:hypothetical protein